MHRFDLLLPLCSGVVKSLVLLLNSSALPSDFLLPLLVIVVLPLLILCFELSDFFQFCLFLYLEDGLFNSLGEKHIENRLDFLVVVEEVIVSNLSDFVDSSLLRHVLWSWRFW